jgi:hypothetical protein
VVVVGIGVGDGSCGVVIWRREMLLEWIWQTGDEEGDLKKLAGDADM